MAADEDLPMAVWSGELHGIKVHVLDVPASACRAVCSISSGLHADDERCTFQKGHDGACSHGIPRDV